MVYAEIIYSTTWHANIPKTQDPATVKRKTHYSYESCPIINTILNHVHTIYKSNDVKLYFLYLGYLGNFFFVALTETIYSAWLYVYKGV